MLMKKTTTMGMNYLEKLGMFGTLLGGVTLMYYGIVSYTDAKKWNGFLESHPTYKEYALVKMHKTELEDIVQRNIKYGEEYHTPEHKAMATKMQQVAGEVIRYYTKEEELLETKIPQDIQEANAIQKQLFTNVTNATLAPFILFSSLFIWGMAGKREEE